MKEFFCGWYFKSQGDKTLAVIPAYHKAHGKTSCSVQIITDGGAWNTVFPFEDFSKRKQGFFVDVGDNHFGEDGMTLKIDKPGINVFGDVKFGAFTPLKYDIMGPFRFVPFMQCRHSVVSMAHTVDGEIDVNGEKYVFDGARGYIEGDRGYSFPKVYLWTQCSFDGGSLMLSVADIPMGPVHFTGIIGFVYVGGKEYRIATYLGAKPEKIISGEVIIRQKDIRLTAKLINKHAHPLFAPVSGAMVRVIRESASCTAAYKFEIGNETLLDFQSDKASFEFEYPN